MILADYNCSYLAKDKTFLAFLADYNNLYPAKVILFTSFWLIIVIYI